MLRVAFCFALFVSAALCQNDCDKNFDVGDLEFKIPSTSSVPSYQFVRISDERTKYKITLKERGAFLGDDEFDLEKPGFSSWNWNDFCPEASVVCDVDEEDSNAIECEFEFDGDNKATPGDEDYCEIAMKQNVSNSGDGIIKFEFDYQGKEIENMVLGSDSFYTQVEVKCQSGSCKSPKTEKGKEFTLEGEGTTAYVNIKKNTVIFYHDETAICTYTEGEDNSSDDSNPCGLKNFRLESDKYDLNLWIEWDNDKVNDLEASKTINRIYFDPEMGVAAASSLVVSFAAALVAMFVFFNQ